VRTFAEILVDTVEVQAIDLSVPDTIRNNKFYY